mgnify:CR=1 FL=1|tara:strand:- start:64 stop:1023 length:960 start_codon:yes stop_codon:yes gene_type:complete
MGLTKTSTDGIKDDAITLDKLAHGTSGQDGKFLRANNGAAPSFETVTGTTINNNADNRVITGSGTANTLEGEANLTFDASTKRLKVNSPAGSQTHTLQVQSDSSANAICIFGRSADDIGELSFLENDGSTRLGEIQYRQDHVAFRHRVGDIRFSTTNSGSMTERLRIQSAGGISFNGDTAAANALDDYEEGTFTPDWRGSNVLGTTTYGFNEASYVKIGNLVTVQGFSEIQSSSGGGPWFIDNMPFNTAGDRAHRCVGTIGLENFNFDSDVVDTFCWIDRNNNNLVLKGTRDNATPSSSISPDNDTGWGITWCITYRTS